ncbi:hypothetical protein NKH48_03370 [Mesorhizobium sp. M1233]|uniref:hypothetical protein n=1 Tax=Mesorhizobium sp. M1233 TaxID=2957072 RepID=UPI00333BD975
MAECSIHGCGRTVCNRRGWCNTHYQRWRNHGDPLVVKSTPSGEPERYYQEVVLGYEGDECLTWPFATKDSGYAQIWVGKKCHGVHRRVCEHVHGPAPTRKHDAAHSCGNGHLACVTKRHLSWKTRKGNMADTLIHGTHSRGTRSSRARLNEAQVREIRALRGNKSEPEIAKQFGVTRHAISNIVLRRTWAWLDDGRPL